ncbi:MAG: DNA-3-methyladenine glycosylase 2 family protein [Flavobacterium sp.]|uniref:DNA-3-methyladenine glycosylase family protein n=1 Tax=Flavobacterium sp. TaxID=239 RepID=UPI002FDA5964|nr:DNA-3-methyladenine glycosylase 2 family protein [Bacteroidota bacterium]
MKIALEYLTTKDKTLAKIIENFGVPIIQKREEGFASLCHIILEQQVSIASAKACYAKIVNVLETITPTSILGATDEILRNCGVSRQKTIYLKHLAQKVMANKIDFDSFATKEETAIRAELIQLKGMGNWSIDVYLMFCLQLPDIIPFGDIAIKKTFKELYDSQTLQEMEQISNQWKPYRTLASFIVWHHYLKSRNRNY